MQILYLFENAKEPMPENQDLRRIHDIIDSIRKSYFIALVKKQNYGVVLENRCSVGILKNSSAIRKYFFS